MSPFAITFVVALILNFAIFMFLTGREKTSKSTSQRLAGIRDSMHTPADIAGSELEKATPWGYWSRFDIALQHFRFGKKLKMLLLHANSGMSLSGVALASCVAGLGSCLICYMFLQMPMIAGAAALAGACTPCLFLKIKCDRRLKAFNTALPDAIDLMARALVAGHSVGSSIEMIAEGSPEPLASEFVQVYQQQRLGLHFREALLQMASRIPSRDLQFFVTAILLQKETGGDLTEILARASHVIRDRIRIEGEVRTHTAQGRLTGWILSLLPVIMLALINLVSPGYSDVLFHDPLGLKLVYTGAALIIIGRLIIRRIVNVQV